MVVVVVVGGGGEAMVSFVPTITARGDTVTQCYSQLLSCSP